MAAAIGVSSCAASGATQPATQRDRAEGLPIGNIVDTASADLDVLADAENLILADCMGERGFSSIESPVKYDSTGTFDFERRYYVRTPEQAETIGYRPLNVDEILEAIAQGDNLVDNETPEYYEALFGDTAEVDGALAPDGTGCAAIAAIAIYGHQDRRLGFNGWATLMQMGDDSYAETISSDAVREAEDAWSVCMADSGYDYAKPQDAINELASNPDDYVSPLTDLERETAVTDVACRRSVDLDQVYFDTESAAQLRRLEEQPELASTVSDQVEAAVEQAKEALGN